MLNNIESSLFLIYYVELMLFLLSIVLISFEVHSLRDVLNNKITLSLVGASLSITMMFITRAWGIYSYNPIMRQYGSAAFGLFTILLLSNWGLLMIQVPYKSRKVVFIAIIISMLIFVLGRLYKINIVQISGMIFLMLILVVIFIKMFSFVFKKSPYIRARQRIFLITCSFVFMIIFETVAVIFMGIQEFGMASLFFSLELPFRFGITLSILLPKNVTKILSKIIK